MLSSKSAPSHAIQGIAWSRFAFLLVVFLALFSNFRFNVFHTVDYDLFRLFQADSQALVDQKFFEVASSGRIEAKKGFLVRSKEMETSRIGGVYPSDVPTDDSIYRSQFGLQGLLGTILQLSLRTPAPVTIALAETLIAAATAAILAWLLSGLLDLRGWRVTSVATTVFVFCPILVLAGRNLYWVVPLLILPFVATWQIYRRKGFHETTLRPAFAAVMGLVFLKCLCGYEYITCLCLAPGVALTAIWASCEFCNPGRFLKHAAILFGAACLGFILAMVVHFVFVWWAVGDLSGAIDAIFGRASAHITAGNVNEHVPEKYRHGLVGTILMVAKYLTFPGIFLGAEVKFGEGSYSLVSMSFLGMVVFVVLVALGATGRSGSIRRCLGPTAVIVAGLLASLSWLIAARGHALHHFHLNSMVFLPLILAFPLALFASQASKTSEPGVRAVDGKDGRHGE